MSYQFITHDWFSQHIPIWQEKLTCFAGMPNVQALEIGSFEGRSAVWLLENLLTGPGTHLTCIDTFILDDEFREIIDRMKLEIPQNLDIEARFDHNIAAAGAEKRVTKLKGSSTEMLRTLPLDRFDLIYIDGSHTARNVLTDAVLCWDLLKRDGILILDDYRWNVFPEDGLKSPRIAIDAFMRCFDGEYVTILMDYQVMLRKTKNIRETVRSLSMRDT